MSTVIASRAEIHTGPIQTEEADAVIEWRDGVPVQVSGDLAIEISKAEG